MTTTTLPPSGQPGPPDRAAPKEEQPYVEVGKKRHTGLKLLGILVFWLVCFFALQGQNTKALRPPGHHRAARKFNEARDWVQLEGQDNWFFGGVLGDDRRLPELGLREAARADQRRDLPATGP